MAAVEQTVSVAELRARLDVLTRKKLGISADEFVERCRTETLDMSSPSVSRLAILGRLLLTADAA